MFMNSKRPRVWVQDGEVCSDCGISGVIRWVLRDAGKLMRPSEILARLKSEFGVELSRQRLNGYLYRGYERDELYRMSRGLWGDADLLMMLS
jgi:hypothetical protein